MPGSTARWDYFFLHYHAFRLRRHKLKSSRLKMCIVVLRVAAHAHAAAGVVCGLVQDSPLQAWSLRLQRTKENAHHDTGDLLAIVSPTPIKMINFFVDMYCYVYAIRRAEAPDTSA
jgi:hypothetical protein